MSTCWIVNIHSTNCRYTWSLSIDVYLLKFKHNTYVNCKCFIFVTINSSRFMNHMHHKLQYSCAVEVGTNLVGWILFMFFAILIGLYFEYILITDVLTIVNFNMIPLLVWFWQIQSIICINTTCIWTNCSIDFSNCSTAVCIVIIKVAINLIC